MLDIIGQERTSILVFINILMMFISYWIFKPALIKPYRISIMRRNIGCFIILLFCLFAFWGTDWFHIAVEYEDLRRGMKSHLEQFYLYLIQNICPDYILFRFVVWGSALVFFSKTVKYLGIKKDLAWVCFVVIGLLWFSYARVSLAMAMMYLGFALYNADNKSFVKKIFAVLFLVGSYFCHKSAMFGIALIIFSSYVTKMNFKILLFLTFSLPLIYFALGKSLIYYMNMQGDLDEGAWGQSLVSAQGYMNKDASLQGIGLILQQFLERTTYIFTAYIGIKAVINERLKKMMPHSIKVLINLLFYIVVVAFLFQFDFGVNTSTIADRFFKFSFIPASLVLAYFISNDIYPRPTKRILLIGLISTFYELFYSLYTCMIS